MDIQKMKDLIEQKKLRGSNRKPRYATRKLSIGLVSCMLGFTLLISPSSVLADEGQVTTELEETAKPEDSDNVDEKEEKEEDKKEEEKTEEEKERIQFSDAQKDSLKEAGYTDAEIASIEAEAKAEKGADENFDVDAFVNGKVAEKAPTEEENEVQTLSEEGAELPAEEDPNALEIDESNKPEEEIQQASSPDGIATRDAAAPEDTATSADAKNAVHGFVGVLVGGDINADLAAETGQRFKPIEGVKVYFQWYEAKGNRTSPTYYAVSGADGQFHIKVKSYIGQDGKLVKFDADTSVSAGNESYKMWVDASTIPEGYQLQYSTGEGV